MLQPVVHLHHLVLVLVYRLVHSVQHLVLVGDFFCEVLVLVAEVGDDVADLVELLILLLQHQLLLADHLPIVEALRILILPRFIAH